LHRNAENRRREDNKKIFLQRKNQGIDFSTDTVPQFVKNEFIRKTIHLLKKIELNII